MGLHVMKVLGIDACWSTDFRLGLTQLAAGQLGRLSSRRRSVDIMPA